MGAPVTWLQFVPWLCDRCNARVVACRLTRVWRQEYAELAAACGRVSRTSEVRVGAAVVLVNHVSGDRRCGCRCRCRLIVIRIIIRIRIRLIIIVIAIIVIMILTMLR